MRIVGLLLLALAVGVAAAIASGRLLVPDRLNPFAPLSAHRWVPYAWAALGIAGAAVQLGITAGKKRR